MKKIFNKRNSILLPLTIFMAVSGFTAANLVDYDDEYAVSAEETAVTPFWISEGAQAYFMKQYDGCLRFDLNMSAEQYNSLKAAGSEDWAETVEVGVLLVPQKVNDGLTLDNTANRYIQNVTLEQGKWIADNEENPETYSAWVAVGGYEFKESRYTLDITAVGYLQTSATEQYTDSVTCSMTEVTYNQKYVEVAFDGTIVTPEWLVQYYANSTSTVTFEANNGSEATKQTLINGYQASEPTAPTVDGWTFDGWYNGEQKYDFSAQVTSDITLNAKYKQTVNVKDAFEVYSGINGTSPVANNLAVTLNNATAMSTVNEYATLNSETLTDYAWENNQFTVSGNVFGANVYGDVEMVITDGNYTATVKVPVVTKYMTSYDDLNNMPYYGGIDLSTTERAYDGYYVMTNNIDCKGAYFTKRNGDAVYGSGDIGNSSKDAYQYVGKCGFAGIFDGQGYAINNAKAIQYFYGLFGNTQTGSVVKNLAVVATMDASADMGRVLLGNNLAGEIQNCYFDVTVGNVTLASGKHLGGALGYFISGKLTDVVVKFDTTNTPTGVSVGGLAFQLHPWSAYWSNQAKFENVHVFTQAEKLYTYVGDKTSINVVNKYGYNDNATVTVTDSTYWNMAGDQPVFKSVMPQAVKTISYNQDFEAYSGISGTTPIANAFTLDLTAHNIPANPNSITIIGERASMTVDNSCWANGILTVADLGAKVYGDVCVEIVTDDVVYKVKAIKVITKYLANYTDLKNIFYYGGIDTAAINKPYDGYFVLSDNIDISGNFYSSGSNFREVTNNYDGTNGFAGVFNGNGYKIYNGTAATNAHGGIFGNVAKTAVIKNVKFVANVKTTNDPWAGGYILGRAVAGLIENVYFDLTITSDTIKASCYLAQYMAHARVKDVVVKLNSLTTSVSKASFAEYGAQWTGSVQANLMTIENVHIFTNVAAAQPYANYYPISGGTTPNIYALEGVPTTAITMTDLTHWDLSGSQPVWKERA